MRDLVALKKFMEAPDENKFDMVNFFNTHSQYWKKAVFLDLLDFYYNSADVMAELITLTSEAERESDGGKNQT